MFDIKVTRVGLMKMRKLADWQLSEMGIDTDSVTMACLQMEQLDELRAGLRQRNEQMENANAD